jgi:hypothetical protein
MSGAAYNGCAPLAAEPTSFDLLPLELRLKCLASCDWQTLARVSCVNRSTRGLVSEFEAAASGQRQGGSWCLAFLMPSACTLLLQVTYLVRTPYWRTYGEEVPAVLTTDFATDEERQAACSKWAVSSQAAILSTLLEQHTALVPRGVPEAAVAPCSCQLAANFLPLPLPLLCLLQAGMASKLCGRGKPDICFVFASASG